MAEQDYRVHLDKFNIDELRDWGTQQPNIDPTPCIDFAAVEHQGNLIITATKKDPTHGVKIRQFFYDSDGEQHDIGDIDILPNGFLYNQDHVRIHLTQFVYKDLHYTAAISSVWDNPSPILGDVPIVRTSTSGTVTKVPPVPNQYKVPNDGIDGYFRMGIEAVVLDDTVFFFEMVRRISLNGHDIYLRRSSPSDDPKTGGPVFQPEKDPQPLVHNPFRPEVGQIDQTNRRRMTVATLNGKIYLVYLEEKTDRMVMMVYDGKDWSGPNPLAPPGVGALGKGWCGGNLVVFDNKLHYFGHLDIDDTDKAHPIPRHSIPRHITYDPISSKWGPITPPWMDYPKEGPIGISVAHLNTVMLFRPYRTY